MRVGTEVGGTVTHNLPCLEYAREVFVAHANGRITLVVFQQDVITGLVFLDEVVFKQQRVFFRIHYNVADVGYLAYQNAGLCRLVLS